MVVCTACGVVVTYRIQAALRARLCPACGSDQVTATGCIICPCCGDCLVCAPYCWCESGECKCGRPRAPHYEL